jgi:branched-subunit amino acid ABC-type transport system permease component
MKILGISILLLGLLAGFSLGIDILLGSDLKTSLKNALNPFRVMDPAELVIFILLLLFLVADPVRSFFRKKKQETTKDKKQHQP